MSIEHILAEKGHTVITVEPERTLLVSCPRFLWTPYCSEKLEDRQHGR
jgi:hypothetical protein